MEQLAQELTALMNEIEQEYKETGIAIGYDEDLPDEDQDPRMVRIGNLISIIEALAPDLLDPRLKYPD
jgi:hypothetical protein